jgi:predicted kinase
MENTCIIVSGVAGVGKSTWVQNWKNTHSQYNVMTISLDDLRFELFNTYVNLTYQQEKIVWSTAIERAIKASNDFDYVIMDSTALKNKRRMWYYNQLKNYYKDFWLIIIDRPLEICLSQNQKRDRHVPDKVIKEMYDYKEQPNDDVKKNFKVVTYINL